jgi:hypothetical protein
MSAFTDCMAKIPKKYVPDIERAISDAAKVLGDPKATDADYKSVDSKLASIQFGVAKDSVNAWTAALKEELKRRLMHRGLSAKDAEELLTPRINRLLRHMESLRGRLQAFLYSGSTKVIATVTAAVAIVSVSVINGMYQGDSAAYLRGHIEQQVQTAQAMASIQVSTGEFQRLVQGLKPAPAVGGSPVAQAQQPAAVAAPEPVQVTISTASGTETFKGDPGAIYSALPPSGRDAVDDGRRRPGWNRCITVRAPVGTFSGCGF